MQPIRHITKCKIESVDASPCIIHVNAMCCCGWFGGSSIDPHHARKALHAHMRQEGCKTGSIETARVSQYVLVEQ